MEVLVGPPPTIVPPGMNTLQRHLLGQVVATMLLAVTVFVFVLLLGNAIREVLLLLMQRQVSPGIVLQALGLLLPYVAPFALPMGLLTATLLVFGRFSADQELTAARASGLSLACLVTPVLALSALLSVVAILFNAEWAPRSRVAYKDVLMRVGLEMAGSLLPEQQYIHDYPGLVLYVGRSQQSRLEQVIVWKLDGQGRAEYWLRAEQGRVKIESGSGRLQLELEEVVAARRLATGWVPAGYARNLVYELEPPSQQPRRSPKLSEMTWEQLFQQLHQRIQQGIDPTPVRVQIHQRAAFGFACFSFCLLGIPLGIRLHRRETNVSVALALVLVAIYFSFLLLAAAWDTRPDRYPQWLVWAPNFLFQGLGAYLLWRCDRAP
ncbi:MAG: LptF/LptG family permease [Verrucomicrobiota bacterium]|nr:LptF/LptG family permease [Limisphaera sp.]MDW8383023.1 LptF/LptG family permease [Verrucomicrobiota bacterium]